MQPRITGWERTSTDSVLARRFVRALFEGRADAASELVTEDCVLHWAGRDDETAGGMAAVDQLWELVRAADVELETVESTVSDGLVVTSVTTSAERATASDSECDRTPFASLRVEDDRIVELWAHVDDLGTGERRSSRGFVGRVSAWLTTG